MSLAQQFNDQWNRDKTQDHYAHPYETAEDSLELTMVHEEIVGEWRWGNILKTVFKDELTDEYISIDHMDVSGDGDIDADGRNVVAYDVVPQQVSRTIYQRI